MKARVLCFRWRPSDRDCARRARRLASALPENEWKKLCDWRGVLIYVHLDSLGEIIVLPSEFGVLIGPLFERTQSNPVSSIDGAQLEDLLVSGGAELFRNFWGPCCALIHDRGHDYLYALRDPAGGAPLYVHEGERLHVCFTQLADFVALWDEPLDCDEEMVSAYLVQPRLLSRRTAIKGVAELLAGERLALGRDSTWRDLFWSPFPKETFEITTFEAAALALRDAVRSSARAWVQFNSACGDQPIVHRLSGGLDSSIVLAALRSEGADPSSVICFNEFPERTPEGDERALARVAAQQFGCSLIEHESRAGSFGYERLLEAPLPVRPTHTGLSHAAPDLGKAIERLGARIVTSGQGGDQVLHRRRFAASAVDAAVDLVGWQAWLKIARDTALLARVPIWDVLTEGAAHLAGRKFSAFNPVFAKTVLASLAAVSIAEEEWRRHPWVELLSHRPPARAARVMHIADLSYYHEASLVTRTFATAPVLASLPVIETVLSIPPYVMTQGGRDRSLARTAFDAELPETIRRRSHKGDTTRFHNRVLERQLPYMRDLLLGGELVRRGLVDGERLSAALGRDVIADGGLKGALTTTFVAEVWLRRFSKLVSAKAFPTHQGETAA